MKALGIFRFLSFFLLLGFVQWFQPSLFFYALGASFLFPLLGLVIIRVYQQDISFLLLFETFSLSMFLGFLGYLAAPFSQLFVGIFLAIFLAYEQLRRETKLKKSTLIMVFVILFLYGYLFKLHQFDVLAVYLFFLLILYLYRRYLTTQGIMLLRKTRWGIHFMDRLAQYKGILKILSDIGIGVGFLGMAAMAVYLLVNLFQVFFLQAPPGISPVLPGVKIPGSPLTLPLWYGLVAIFLVAVIHEFSHGVIARLSKLKVKHTGVIMLGPFVGGAFVDIDEQQLQKAPPRKQLRVLAAGPFSNLLTGLFVFLVLSLFLNPFLFSLVSPAGVKISVIPETPAASAGFKDGMVLIGVLNQTNTSLHPPLQQSFIPLTNPHDLFAVLNASPVNQTLTFFVLDSPDPYVNITQQFSSAKSLTVRLGAHPDNKTKPYLGVYLAPYVVFKDESLHHYGKTLIAFFLIVQEFFFWFFVISLGIGVANLLPLGPVDGGRMLLVVLERMLPQEKARLLWEKIAMFFLLVIGLILFSPAIKFVLGL